MPGHAMQTLLWYKAIGLYSHHSGGPCPAADVGFLILLRPQGRIKLANKTPKGGLYTFDNSLFRISMLAVATATQIS